MPRVRGRPHKRQRVTHGLRNHSPKPQPPSSQVYDAESDAGEPLLDPNVSRSNVSAGAPTIHTRRIHGEQEGGVIESEVSDSELELDIVQDRLVAFAWKNGDVSDSEVWLPPRLRRQQASLSACPSTYKKGPDVGDKSAHTQRRYKSLLSSQSTLDSFFIKPPNRNHISPCHPVPHDTMRESAPSPEPFVVPSQVQSLIPPLIPSVRPRSPSTSRSDSSVEEAGDDMQSDSSLDETEDDVWLDSLVEEVEDAVDLEDELFQAGIAEAVDEIRDWNVLRAQIKTDLKARYKSFSPTQINQLLIIRGFATLCLKGIKRIPASMEVARQWHEGSGKYFACHVHALARHYQIFEQLPIEKRGGRVEGRSVFDDETVQAAARQWLTDQTAGSVTTQIFQNAINSAILPALNIALRTPISRRTSRQWLGRLGWHHTMLQKGVYMDGHERLDVVKYRQEVFLPAMEKYEKFMVQHIGEELKRVEPVLQPGQKKMILLYHDESCFHANDFKSTAWLKSGQTVLQKKSRGHLIHVSDFINEEKGRLILRDQNGTIICDARKIIYPGAQGDPWWDTTQLLTQMKEALEIFDLAHPDCIGVFLFDQSSAHGSLGPDALNAFDMNKSNGGKQRHRRDTVIPMTNPTIHLRGLPQKMTTDKNEVKGLQQTLMECGFNVDGMRAKCSPVCPWENDSCCMARLLSKQEDFANQISMLEALIIQAGHKCIFLPKFHCELNPIEMYWGWAKYRYREVFKKSFQDAKNAALEALDSCPIEVIRHFINRSWRFQSAYRKGLTGKAADWAVKQQKRHRTVSQAAMHHLDSVLN